MEKFKKFFTKKRVIIGVIVLILAILIISRLNKTNTADIQTDTVKKQDLKATVLATGQVVSSTDLSLSFKSSGIVSRVNAQVGKAVKAGEALANLSQSDQAARLTQARGALAQAEANLRRVLDGASGEEVAVAQVALDSARKNLEDAKKQQQVAVDNARKALYNSTPAAVAGSGNSGSATVTISGVYTGKEQGQYTISLYYAGDGTHYQVSGLESYNSNNLIDTTPQLLGARGLYVQFSSAGIPSNNIWTVSIPNTQAGNYVANLNAYNAALETQRSALTSAENAVNAAQANLDLKKARARPADVQATTAQVTSALGQMQAANADFENTILRAPAAGTITKVDVKVGELASASKEAVVLQDIGNLHVEANISEANIASLKLDQPVELTFDALGLDRKYTAFVRAIDPASTLISGVINYKVTAGLEKIDDAKPGMSANLTILTAEKKDVLAVPQRAIIIKDDKKVARIVTDTKTKKYEEREITTGLEGDGGMVEILSGLSEGQEVVTFIKSK